MEEIIKLEKIVNNDFGNTTGIVIYKKGKTVYKSYFNQYDTEDGTHIASVTKSIVSILIGIAINKGYIKSIEQKVLDFFPDYKVEEDRKLLQTITLGDVLKMTVPYQCEIEPYEDFFSNENWLKFALDLLDGNGEIGKFRYSPIVGTHILSGILASATKRSILDFAEEYLFAPLEIETPENVILHNREEHFAFLKRKNRGWVMDPQGLHTAGWGLVLSTADMAKIGQLCLDRGKWKGKEIVSEQWMIESTKGQSYCQDFDLSYGYLWWIIDKKEASYAAMGDGGNVIYVNPAREIVVSISSFFVPEARDRMELIKKYIEPMCDKIQ